MLIAGEDRLYVSILRTYIADLVHTAETTTSLAAFRRMAASGGYNVIVTLFEQPFLDGSDLGHSIPSRSIASPAIFVLSFSQYEPHVMSLCESGIDQYINLPCDMRRLRSRIAMYLRKNKR